MPIDVELQVDVRVERIDRRKIYTRGRVRHGEMVCGEGDALFLELTPDQGWGRCADGGFMQFAAQSGVHL